MTYHGKRYLYNFLKEHGYDVPKMKEMQYYNHRGSEWLKTDLEDIELYSPSRGVIYVTINDIDDETCDKHKAEYSEYVNGVLNYQEKNNTITVMGGKKL